MFTIKSIAVDHFQIPLPLASADSTHGEIAHFGPIAGRLLEVGRDGTTPISLTILLPQPSASLSGRILLRLFLPQLSFY